MGRRAVLAPTFAARMEIGRIAVQKEPTVTVGRALCPRRLSKRRRRRRIAISPHAERDGGDAPDGRCAGRKARLAMWEPSAGTIGDVGCNFYVFRAVRKVNLTFETLQHTNIFLVSSVFARSLFVLSPGQRVFIIELTPSQAVFLFFYCRGHARTTGPKRCRPPPTQFTNQSPPSPKQMPPELRSENRWVLCRQIWVHRQAADPQCWERIKLVESGMRPRRNLLQKKSERREGNRTSRKSQ